MTANLRRIDLSDLAPVSAGEQAHIRPEIAWVDIDRLVIDERYQRPIERRGLKNIQEIANAFAWSRFTPVLLAPIGDEMLAVIDGQHRVHAAALCGFAQVPAMVVEMAPEEQARAFAWVNGRVTAVSKFHIYKAALAAGEQWALDCRRTVADADCTLMTTNYSTNSKKPGQVFCVDLIKSQVARGRAPVVRRGLKAIRQSSSGHRTEYYGATILHAWFTVIDEKQVRAVPVLVEFLNAHPFSTLLHKVDRLRETQQYFNKSRRVLFQASLGALLGQFLFQREGGNR